MNWLTKILSMFSSKKEDDIETSEPKVITDTLTGNELTWIVPDGMKSIVVKIYSSNGTFKKRFVITDWITIQEGWKIKLEVVGGNSTKTSTEREIEDEDDDWDDRVHNQV
jgi:hypothetical protein